MSRYGTGERQTLLGEFADMSAEELLPALV
jgi:hypothetical protein